MPTSKCELRKAHRESLRRYRCPQYKAKKPRRRNILFTVTSRTAVCGPACTVVWELRLEAHEIQLPEMATAAELSQQLRTESCVMPCNGHCKA
jgi:hypothetical protein